VAARGLLVALAALTVAGSSLVPAGSLAGAESYRARERVTVPDVVGDSARGARRVLARHSLKPDFTPGVVPIRRLTAAQSAQAIEQYQRSGRRLRAGSTVDVPVDALHVSQPSSEPGRNEPRCPRSAYSLHVLGDTPEYTGGSLDAQVGFELHARNARRCVLHATAHLAVIAMRGARPPIEGNPATIHVDMPLPRRMLVAWAWRNWCEPTRGMKLHIELQGREHRAPAHRFRRGRRGPLIPYCVGSKYPSTLVPYKYYDGP
jgi:hypothetical protein